MNPGDMAHESRPTMETDADFARRIGRLVKGHQHGLAVLQLGDRAFGDAKVQQALDALLRATSGYTRAVIRSWVQGGSLERSLAPAGVESQPISPPSLLADAVRRLQACDPEALKAEAMDDLVDCAIVAAFVFDSLERSSKPQRVQGETYTVKELAPCLLALLPPRLPRAPGPCSEGALAALRAEGRACLHVPRAVEHCRVCGLAQVDPPWGADGKSPSFELCDCCGVEFGYDDATPTAIEASRSRWLESGAKWVRAGEQPRGWDLSRQLAQIGIVVANDPARGEE